MSDNGSKRVVKISNLKIRELKIELEKRKLEKKGNKATLVTRLQNSLNSQFIEVDNNKIIKLKPGPKVVDNVLARNIKYKVKAPKKRLSTYFTYGGNKLSSNKLINLIQNIKKSVKKLQLSVHKLQVENKELRQLIEADVKNQLGDMTKNVTINNVDLPEEQKSDNTSAPNIVTVNSNELVPDKNLLIRHENQINKVDTAINTGVKQKINNLQRKNKKSDTLNKIKSRVLVVADSQGRDLFRYVRNMFPKDDFQIQIIFKPNATFTQVTADIRNLSKTYGKTDYVVIIGGSNDALVRKLNLLTVKTVSEILTPLNNTNVILFSVPYFEGHKNLAKTVYKINMTLYSGVLTVNKNQSDIIYCDTNTFLDKTCFTSAGIHLNHKGKLRLANQLKNSIKMLENYHQQSSGTVYYRRVDFINLNNIVKIKTIENPDVYETYQPLKLNSNEDTQNSTVTPGNLNKTVSDNFLDQFGNVETLFT